MERETFLTLHVLLYRFINCLSRQFVSFFRFISFLFVGIRGEMSRVVWNSSLSCGVIWGLIGGCERGFGKVIDCGKVTTLHTDLLTI